MIGKAHWPALTILNLGIKCINLGDNKIDNKGISSLVKANFSQLQVLFLSNSFMMA